VGTRHRRVGGREPATRAVAAVACAGGFRDRPLLPDQRRSRNGRGALSVQFEAGVVARLCSRHGRARGVGMAQRIATRLARRALGSARDRGRRRCNRDVAPGMGHRRIRATGHRPVVG
jgi:hypothetical protein